MPEPRTFDITAKITRLRIGRREDAATAEALASLRSITFRVVAETPEQADVRAHLIWARLGLS